MNKNLQKLNTRNKKSPQDEWYTPNWVVEKLGSEIDYDPATTKWNAKRLKIPNFDTIKTDGLKQNWNERSEKNIWINPPFTLKKEFIAKAVETIKNGYKGKIFILVPDKSITNKYMAILKDIEWGMIVPCGRINFIDKKGRPSEGAFFGSVILELNSTGITQWLEEKEV